MSSTSHHTDRSSSPAPALDPTPDLAEGSDAIRGMLFGVLFSVVGFWLPVALIVTIAATSQ